jgi:hypothetical protein
MRKILLFIVMYLRARSSIKRANQKEDQAQPRKKMKMKVM